MTPEVTEALARVWRFKQSWESGMNRQRLAEDLQLLIDELKRLDREEATWLRTQSTHRW